MKTYDEQEDLRDSDTEITLGMKSILGIFFGLALICGIFFGFGYSLGRGNTVKPALPAAAMPQSIAAAPQQTSAEASPIKTVVEGASSSLNASSQVPGKPSAESAVVVAQPSAPATGALVPAVQTQPVSPVNTTSAPVANAAAANTGGPGSIMVQIAAVSRPDDANALVAALRKLGYSAYARTQPGDSLLHVQIGPFATRNEAMAVRSHLLSDGYNAILK